MDTYFTVVDPIRNVILILIIIFDAFIAICVYSAILTVRKEYQHFMRGENEYEPPQTTEEAVRLYTDDWRRIKTQVQAMNASEWKLSIIEADKLVDEVLRAQGYAGESMGERLMGIDPSSFLTLQDLWDAHKLRNVLVHDMNQVITKEQAMRAVESYERFLQELGFFS